MSSAMYLHIYLILISSCVFLISKLSRLISIPLEKMTTIRVRVLNPFLKITFSKLWKKLRRSLRYRTMDTTWRRVSCFISESFALLEKEVRTTYIWLTIESPQNIIPYIKLFLAYINITGRIKEVTLYNVVLTVQIVNETRREHESVWETRSAWK